MQQSWRMPKSLHQERIKLLTPLLSFKEMMALYTLLGPEALKLAKKYS